MFESNVYRIYFQSKGAYWCIQFHSLFGWKTVQREHEGPGTPTHTPLRFDSYKAAQGYVQATGIAEAYPLALTKMSCLAGAPTAAQYVYHVPEGSKVEGA